ncbi:coactosin like F-actin binding protein 1 [Ictidomys tridecemlineatus]|nr:coactosin like F-actin binding protein 1 [Ictidomys tridecemlineatus]
MEGLDEGTAREDESALDPTGSRSRLSARSSLALRCCSRRRCIPPARPRRVPASLRSLPRARGALGRSGQCSGCSPAAMATKIDKEACRAAYNLVRDDNSAVIWVTFKYEGSTIVPGEQGAEYQHFIQQCTDDVRLFAFVRFTTGDALSKRSKFALITWIGENVSGLQRAKTGTDKTLVKEVVQNFAKEFVISDRKELEEDFIKGELKKGGVTFLPP